MTNYEAPAITANQSMDGRLFEVKSHLGGSDAEIKHGIEEVTSYEAPAIVEQAPLNGSLTVIYRSIEK